MRVNPYLQFGGSCAQAIEYYRQHLGATDIMLMPFRGSPAAEHAPAEWQDKIMHGSFKIGNELMMASDGMHGQPFEGMKGCSITLSTDSAPDAERIYAALADGGQATMPLSATFFAEKFGALTDRFGIAWMVIFQGRHAQPG
jgi:PhnB protein